MMRSQIANFQNSAAQVFLAIAPALMTAALFRLGVGLAATAFAYLLAMVLFSLEAVVSCLITFGVTRENND
jgi:hypothetical protein